MRVAGEERDVWALEDALYDLVDRSWLQDCIDAAGERQFCFIVLTGSTWWNDLGERVNAADNRHSRLRSDGLHSSRGNAVKRGWMSHHGYLWAGSLLI